VLLALVVIACAVAAPAARAQQAPQQVDSFALSPTGTDPSQPGSRPYLSYTLGPSATVTDSVTLWNYGNSQLTFHVYSPDAFNNGDGSFALQEGKKPPRDVGAWVALSRTDVTLPPATKTDIPFILTVPAGASPGDHTAAIIASSKTDATTAEGKHVVLDRRTGTRLYVRVTGPANPDLVVENMSSDYHGAVNPLDGSLDVSYTVRNTGNVRLGARQTVDIDDLFGSVGHRDPCPTTSDKKKLAAAQADHCLPNLPELLPGNAVTIHQHFDGVAATIRVTADVKVQPVAAPAAAEGSPPKLVTEGVSQSAWAIPWVLVALLVLLAVVIWISRRRRRSRETEGGQPPTGSGPYLPPGGGGPGDYATVSGAGANVQASFRTAAAPGS
jgi:hypothetical protein